MRSSTQPSGSSTASRRDPFHRDENYIDSTIFDMTDNTSQTQFVHINGRCVQFSSLCNLLVNCCIKCHYGKDMQASR